MVKHMFENKLLNRIVANIFDKNIFKHMVNHMINSSKWVYRAHSTIKLKSLIQLLFDSITF